MKIDIESIAECKALMAFIRNYESEIMDKDILDKDMLDDVAIVMSEIISATDRFRIKESFDLIGPVECLRCGKKWIAILSKKRKNIECPKCGFINTKIGKCI